MKLLLRPKNWYEPVRVLSGPCAGRTLERVPGGLRPKLISLPLVKPLSGKIATACVLTVQ